MSEKKVKKLCKLVKQEYHKDHLDKYIDLVQNPKFVCAKCGRVAENSELICKAIKLAKN